MIILITKILNINNLMVYFRKIDKTIVRNRQNLLHLYAYTQKTILNLNLDNEYYRQQK